VVVWSLLTKPLCQAWSVSVAAAKRWPRPRDAPSGLRQRLTWCATWWG